MNTFHAQILTPQGSIFEGDVTGVKMPGTLGSFEVKYNHANLVSSLDIGEIRVREADGNDQYIAVAGGFVEVNDNKLTLLAEIAERADDIDLERAEKAKKTITQKLQEEENPDRENLEQSLKKAKNRIKVANRL